MWNKMLQFLKSNFYTIYWIFNPNRQVAITFKGIYNYFQAHYRAFKGFENLPLHIQEQVIERKRVSKCSNLEFCSFCGCPMEELFLGDEGCKNNPPCFGKLLNKQEYEISLLK